MTPKEAERCVTDEQGDAVNIDLIAICEKKGDHRQTK